ncbi:MAG: S66 peptidase family protein [Halolamina sp.]
MTFTTPPALERGDTVGLVAPSSPIGSDRVERLRTRLDRSFDLDLRVFESVERGDETGTPAERADELARAYRDEAVDAVLAATGGNDQIRLLKHLDDRLDAETAASKRFYGYSDNDNVRLWLWNRGIVSFGSTAHPDLVVGDELHPYTERTLSRALFEDSLGEVEPPVAWTDEWYDFESAGDGRDWRDADPWRWEGDRTVSGPIWGGCLSIVEWQLMADRWLPEPDRLDGAVLALEPAETMPVPRRFRYLLRSLGERGWLGRFEGVLVGRPRGGTPTVDRETEYVSYRDAIREAVRAPLSAYNPQATVAFEVDFGHTEPRFPLPLGATATMEPEAGRLRFD